MISRADRSLLILDHFDSFTFNLVSCFEILGCSVHVLRTDVSMDVVADCRPTHLVLSPGPGHPKDTPLFLEAIDYFKDTIPVLGVCLGAQSIAMYLGASVKRNYRIMHGKTSMINHNGADVFKDIESPFEACRYHSLVIDPMTCPDNSIEITAVASDDHAEIMGIASFRHPNLTGFQFHPESQFTPSGLKLLKNFLKT